MENFNHEIEKLLPRLRQYALALTRDPIETDDLTQASVTKAIANCSKWTPGTDLRAWTFAIMHNLFITERRRLAASPVSAIGGEVDWHMGRPADQEHRMQLADLERALAHLSADQRAMVLLTGFGGADYRQIARDLDLPMGTVKSRLSRARKKLRRLVDGVASVAPMKKAALPS